MNITSLPQMLKILPPPREKVACSRRERTMPYFEVKRGNGYFLFFSKYAENTSTEFVHTARKTQEFYRARKTDVWKAVRIFWFAQVRFLQRVVQSPPDIVFVYAYNLHNSFHFKVGYFLVSSANEGSREVLFCLAN